MDSIVFYFRCLCLLPPLLCFGGCARFESDTRPEDPVKQDMTYVSFNIGTASLETRDASVAAVNDINVYAYRNGKLEGNVYSDNLRKTGMYLESGKEYVFYALANVGQSYPPLEESELKALRNTVSGPDGLDLDAAVPMSATGTAVVDGAHCSLGIKLTAMVAKIGLKVESCEGFEVHTVRFMNIAADYCPFAASSQARAVMTEEFTGDSDEIREINSGKIIYVPVLENCQGSLFPANEDSRDKTPENLSDDRRALCTYVEVCASHNVSGQAAEDAVYRFCLGQDAVSDCNVTRNTYTRVTLRITGAGSGDFSWKLGRDIPIPDVRLVAAGSSGKVIYTDSAGEVLDMKVGETGWYDIIHAGDRYVMVGEDGWTACSDDGAFWDAVKVSDADWQSVAYGSGKYVAVGYKEYRLSKAYPTQMKGYVAVSEDGVSWNVSEMEDFCLEDIACGGGVFVITGYYKTPAGSFTSGRFFISSDAGSWTESHVYDAGYPCIVYGNDVFAVIGHGSFSCSSDGVSWTPPEDIRYRYVNDIAYGNGTYVAVGFFGTVIYSLGGLGWDKADVSVRSLSGVAYGGGCFIASGDDGVLMYSSDGNVWKTIDTGQDEDLYCVCMK